MIFIEFGVIGKPLDPQTISAQVLESNDRLEKLILFKSIAFIDLDPSSLVSLSQPIIRFFSRLVTNNF